ncbi:hypothetical protein V8B55DRAFT_1535422 [Mucor lusitanicus]|uniref:Late embryogenesis abundant protein LEA-2 subgroup domain-containing protein n=2 Tax=Mucor circinelloides f. lusitanicus TaxID=29924 RepID=A0A168IAR3_MUCCL|nr:hypothetical protein FB192DRAFT_1381053 [Mucor lusitanicus]OAC99754.1 hypothetical protein MUCCIDRAFT_83862 [Mucor lusitanicus CBS 277.49]
MAPPNSDQRDMYPATSTLGPPPSLPAHYQHMSPSPTPTVKPNHLEDPYYSDKLQGKERNQMPELGPEHDADMENGGENRKKRRMEDRNCCVRCMCCACCLPIWAAGILWFIIIAIIIVVIVIGAIAGTFIMPTVDMAGVSTTPTTGSQFSFTGDGISINFGLIVAVNNPNLLSIDLTDINATAYYPNDNGGHTYIGKGYLAEQNVPKYSNFNFTFPFSLEYNPSYDADQSVLNDLVEKCGLSGGEKKDITIDYTIRLTAKVLVIKVHPTISSSATFACPIDNGGLAGLGDGTLGL